MANASAPINQLLVDDVAKGSTANPVVTYNGAKVLECFYGDGIW